MEVVLSRSNPRIRVGVDIGGTKMLLLARGEDFQTQLQIDTSSNFSGADAEIEIDRFIQTFSILPISIGLCSRLRVSDVD